MAILLLFGRSCFCNLEINSIRRTVTRKIALYSYYFFRKRLKHKYAILKLVDCCSNRFSDVRRRIRRGWYKTGLLKFVLKIRVECWPAIAIFRVFYIEMSLANTETGGRIKSIRVAYWYWTAITMRLTQPGRRCYHTKKRWKLLVIFFIFLIKICPFHSVV